jgi:hypothetical protein
MGTLGIIRDMHVSMALANTQPQSKVIHCVEYRDSVLSIYVYLPAEVGRYATQKSVSTNCG